MIRHLLSRLFSVDLPGAVSRAHTCRYCPPSSLPVPTSPGADEQMAGPVVVPGGGTGHSTSRPSVEAATRMRGRSPSRPAQGTAPSPCPGRDPDGSSD